MTARVANGEYRLRNPMQENPPAAPLIQPLTLEWILAPMRPRMDAAQVCMSLAQWQMLPMQQREPLARMADDATTS